MNFKKILKTLCLSLALFSVTAPLSGCGFFGGDEGTTISEIKTSYDEETGETTVTIIYLDEEREPVEFIIPPGQDGLIGAGVEDIVASPSTTDGMIILTITYTDDREPTVIEVPVIKGEDGISIENIVPTYNADGSITLTITYKDNRLPQRTIEIGAPEKGDPGLGIESIVEVDNSDGSKTLVITYTDETTKEVTIPAPEKGETGNGISFILAEETSTQYVLTVFYTDGSDQTIRFNKPTQPNTWHAGFANPNTMASFGENGDFYLDKTTMTIYQKVGGVWVEIATLESNKQVHKVTFNPNGGNFGSDVVSPIYEINHGYSFYSTPGYYLPSVNRDGYKFLGWYTSPIVNNVNSGQFTDLTPVLSDMTVYAWWEEIK